MVPVLQVSHLNFYSNNITHIAGLHQLYWPNLMRITLRSNDLQRSTIAGTRMALFCRTVTLCPSVTFSHPPVRALIRPV